MSMVRRKAPPRPASRPWSMTIAIVTLAIVAMAIHAPVLDPEGRPDNIHGTWEMVEAHSPVLRFSTGERAFPSPVEYFLERSSLVDLAGTVVSVRPTAEDLEEAGPLLFLDLEDGALESYERDRHGLAPTVYARVFENGGKIILQYWMFYVFNDGRLNFHEGDWEMVQVTLSGADARPESVELSQHHSGHRISWSEVTEVVNGTHPVVMVSRGSHANYDIGARLLVYGDTSDGEGEEWSNQDYSLVPIGTGAEGMSRRGSATRGPGERPPVP